MHHPDASARKPKGTSLLLSICVAVWCVVAPARADAAVADLDNGPVIIAFIPHPLADPLGPFIREAVQRYRIPELWVREVILRESGGAVAAVSPAGAIGPMQVIPATYDRLRQVYGLGPSPRLARDNILAGAAFLRELYDRFGFPGVLAAYNAGPNRMDRFLASVSPLPAETIRYVEVLAAKLGGTAKPSGPLAVFVPGWAETQRLPAVITPNSPSNGRGAQIFRLNLPGQLVQRGAR
jgi:hypothetical protein